MEIEMKQTFYRRFDDLVGETLKKQIHNYSKA